MDEHYAFGNADAALVGFAQTPMQIVVFEGSQGVVTAMNRAWHDTLGGRIGLPMREAMPELVGRQMIERVEQVYRTGRPFVSREWPVKVHGPGGALVELVVDLTLSPYRSPDGRTLGVIGQGVDVTEVVRPRQAAEPAHLRGDPEETTALVTALQDAMLPSVLPVLPGLELAASYLLADHEQAAGGDWFDAMPLAGGRVALAVGDVVGHGMVASTVMGQLRAVLRERLLSGAPIEQALRGLDRFAAVLPDAHSTTVCLAVLDLGSGWLRYCTAGHPPPLVVSAAGGTRFLPTSGAGPLATGSGFHPVEERLEVGDLVLFYTDGVIERPGRPAPRSTVELAQAVTDAVRHQAGRPGVSALATERACHGTLELLTRMTGHTDDVTLLAAQRTPRPGELRLRLSAEPRAIREVRGELGRWLHGIHARSLDQMFLQHAVGELVTNVVMHAYRDRALPGGIDVRVRLDDRGVATATVADRGTWREPAGPPSRKSGLVMARSLVSAMQVDHDDRGTTVTLRSSLSRPTRLLRGENAPPPTDTPMEEPVFGHLLTERRLVLRGPLDQDAAEALRLVLRRAADGSRQVVVDLTEVTQLASAGVRVLYDVLNTPAAGEGSLVLFAPPGSAAQHVLTLVRLPYRATDPDRG